MEGGEFRFAFLDIEPPYDHLFRQNTMLKRVPTRDDAPFWRFRAGGFLSVASIRFDLLGGHHLTHRFTDTFREYSGCNKLPSNWPASARDKCDMERLDGRKHGQYEIRPLVCYRHIQRRGWRRKRLEPLR